MTLPQIISTAMLPSLGMWQLCLDSAVGLSDQSWAGPRNRFGEAQCDLIITLPALPLSPGSRSSQELFLEATYEEISYSPVWEKQTRFGRSGVCVCPPWRYICRTLSPGPNPGLIP